MQPIAQTFIISQPQGGVDAVFLTQVDLFFRTASTIFGVDVEIRETDNGVPTLKTLPYSKIHMLPSNVLTSSDSSVATTFTFESPVLVKSNTQYAIVVIPAAGCSEYTIWTAEATKPDVITTAAIYTNTNFGSLFISSNDLTFTQVINESLKYKLYQAVFTTTSAVANFKNDSTETFQITNSIGNWIGQEKLVVSNNVLTIASMGVSGSNTFTVGETVFQPGGTVSGNLAQSTANGVVYFANTSKVVLNNIRGIFTTSNTLRSVTSNLAIATPASVRQNVVVSSACTVITVPEANNTVMSDFVVNNFIYIGQRSGAYYQIVQIANTDATVGTITVSPAAKFSDTDAIIGRVKSDANLTGNFFSITDGPNYFLTVGGSTANTTENFSNSNGALIIARTSGASATIASTFDLPYESITETIPNIELNMTNINWSFKGTDTTKAFDSASTNLATGVPLEFTDKTRIRMSRSNEFQYPPSTGVGNSSLIISAALTTSNTYITPYIDTIQSAATLTHNMIYPTTALSGYIMSYSNTNGNFQIGDTVQQSNSTVITSGTINFSNSTLMYVGNVTSSNSRSISTFNTANASVYNFTRTISANVSAIKAYGETSGNNFLTTSRYISKNVILNEGQDAEDLLGYVTAYRPSGTNIQVYGKVLNNNDPDRLSVKDWSYMPENVIGGQLLTSSAIKRGDYVELTYSLPTSLLVLNGGQTVNTTSASVTVSSTSSFTTGQFVYLTDTVNGGFCVRKITQIPNTTFMALSSNVSFASTNTVVGTIVGLQSQSAAFKYAANSGIVRYLNSADAVYDTYLTFAIKIVLTSNTSHIVPRMSDMRCLALQL